MSSIIEHFCEEMGFIDGEDFFPDIDFLQEKWGGYYYLVDDLTDQDSIDAVLVMWCNENKLFDWERIRSHEKYHGSWEVYLFPDRSYLLLTNSWWSIGMLHQGDRIENVKIGEIGRLFFDRIIDL